MCVFALMVKFFHRKCLAFVKHHNLQDDAKTPIHSKLNSAGVSTPVDQNTFLGDEPRKDCHDDENPFVRTSSPTGQLLRISTTRRSDRHDKEIRSLATGELRSPARKSAYDGDGLRSPRIDRYDVEANEVRSPRKNLYG
jgi:hypothetical protein